MAKSSQAQVVEFQASHEGIDHLPPPRKEDTNSKSVLLSANDASVNSAQGLGRFSFTPFRERSKDYHNQNVGQEQEV